MTGISRSIAAQKSCSFSTTISLDKVTGQFWFGFNNSGNQNFLFKSGLIYDITNQPIFSYTQNVQTIISGTIESGHINYWINNIPISFEGNLPNYISGFNYTWDETKVNPDYNLTILGDIPPFFITGFSPVTTGQNITGYIKNLHSDPHLSFRIFSGDISNFTSSFNYLYTGNILGGQSGQFILTGMNNIGIFNLPLQFETNFGQLNQSVQITVTGNG